MVHDDFFCFLGRGRYVVLLWHFSVVCQRGASPDVWVLTAEGISKNVCRVNEMVARRRLGLWRRLWVAACKDDKCVGNESSWIVVDAICSGLVARWRLELRL